jgi:hypothetical protein
MSASHRWAKPASPLASRNRNIATMTNAANATTNTATAATNHRRNLMRFSPDWWAFWAGVWAVGLTAAAALAGIVAWYFSNVASAQDDARTRALELRIAEQQERAAKAERDLLALSKQIAPRRLTDGQRAVLIASLRAASSKKGSVVLTAAIGDGDALAYRSQIESVLREADWPIVQIREAQIGGLGGPMGLVLSLRDPSRPPPSAIALRDAFQAAGIGTIGVMDHRLGHDVVDLVVHPIRGWFATQISPLHNTLIRRDDRDPAAVDVTT